MNQRLRSVNLLPAVTVLALLLVTLTLFATAGSRAEAAAATVGQDTAIDLADLQPSQQASPAVTSLSHESDGTAMFGVDADELPAIDATLRISIPFGFQSLLPVRVDGRGVLASGHGGCTAGEEVTIDVTVTQTSTGIIATGQTAQTCTGELQTWNVWASAETAGTFADGPAQACGLATTYAAGYETDTYEWCKDVDLALLDHQTFLPLTEKNR